MSPDQRSELWRFARGDADLPKFEPWLYKQMGLEAALGDDLHLQLISCDFSDREQVWQLRTAIKDYLEIDKQCECPSLQDLQAISMGGDWYFERVFANLDQVFEFGEEKWWLYISKCTQCGQLWMVAQDDRIYDVFLLTRIDNAELTAAKTGEWPTAFLTYERVLMIARDLCTPPVFLDCFAHSLQWTVEDLLKERSAITDTEIAHLLGLSEKHSEQLVWRVKTYGADAVE